MADHPSIKLRIALNPDTLLGPGKAALLQAIDETGSIAAAGRRMGMSYKRAWYLIDTMNAYFHKTWSSRSRAATAAVGQRSRRPAGRCSMATGAWRVRRRPPLPATSRNWPRWRAKRGVDADGPGGKSPI